MSQTKVLSVSVTLNFSGDKRYAWILRSKSDGNWGMTAKALSGAQHRREESKTGSDARDGVIALLRSIVSFCQNCYSNFQHQVATLTSRAVGPKKAEINSRLTEIHNRWNNTRAYLEDLIRNTCSSAAGRGWPSVSVPQLPWAG